ncbi:MAG TPA: glycosyltransferase family 2 protein [Pseudanabaena sp.]|nr:glycosyltransferase family 2 protein [Pseudanabaena sp.]
MQSNISVVITCYQEGKLIIEAVDSVINQSSPAKEIILVNDASPDEETNRICQELAQKSLVKLVRLPQNRGTSVAINTGFDSATGKFVFCLDGDDLLPENAIALITESISQNPEVGFVYGGYLRQDQELEQGQAIYPDDISLQNMLSSKRFSVSSRWNLIRTNPIRKTLWEQLKGYDPEFGVADLHDVEFWIRVLDSGCSYARIPHVIYIWRKYLGKNTRKVTPLAWYRLVKKHLKIYQSINLEYRAYELLLLGSKWLEDQSEIHVYSQKLRQQIQQGKFNLTSLFVLLLPASFLKDLASLAQRHR